MIDSCGCSRQKLSMQNVGGHARPEERNYVIFAEICYLLFKVNTLQTALQALHVKFLACLALDAILQ